MWNSSHTHTHHTINQIWASQPEHWLKMQKERDESLHKISSTGESSQWRYDDSYTKLCYFEPFSASFEGNVYIGKSNLKMQAQ